MTVHSGAHEMLIDRIIITQLDQIPWFENCGSSLPGELEHVQRVLDEQVARILFLSDEWEDARTAAQGDLTGYLSEHQYSSYGGYWNNLAKEATTLVEEVVQEPLLEALHRRGWNEEMVKPVIFDLTRAVLEFSYRVKFRKAPSFFNMVLDIYKAGHLPCGWSGEMSQWPEGAIIAY